MCENSVAREFDVKDVLLLGENGEQFAANLYDKLREGERCYELIIAVAPNERGGVMAGVMNRLTKACGG